MTTTGWAARPLRSRYRIIDFPGHRIDGGRTERPETSGLNSYALANEINERENNFDQKE